MMQRFAGVVLFFAAYVAQLIAFNGSLEAFNQSLLLIFLIPAIFIFGWLLGGLILGGLVLKPSGEKRPWRNGLLYALLFSVIFGAAIFAYQSSIPNTGRGL